MVFPCLYPRLCHVRYQFFIYRHSTVITDVKIESQGMERLDISLLLYFNKDTIIRVLATFHSIPSNNART